MSEKLGCYIIGSYCIIKSVLFSSGIVRIGLLLHCCCGLFFLLSQLKQSLLIPSPKYYFGKWEPRRIGNCGGNAIGLILDSTWAGFGSTWQPCL